MINEAHLQVTIHLNTDELWITMLKIWDFTSSDMELVTGFSKRRIKTTCTYVNAKLGNGNPHNVRVNAERAGFNTNGTLNGEEIFSDEQKRKILLINPAIQFLFPPK